MSLQQISVIFFIAFLLFVGLVAFISGKLGAKQTSGSADVDYYLGGIAPTQSAPIFNPSSTSSSPPL